MTRPPADLLAIRDAQIRICSGCDNRVLGNRTCGLCAILHAAVAS